ncbi:hypothetical protein LTR36_001267 [Oleoguttula mirabilis]|uniref:Apple domain-containing protein n=1 Tax=Oleoguttula mirabilis TaxID=1507867 RepID=A0AAV9JP03_9PEZI|nr:hypothetical protein LTR36_001267 [Oleoguttula mirabilis]
MAIMRRFGVLAFVAGLLSFAFAQTESTAIAGGATTTRSTSLAAATTYQPTNTWTIASGACSVGMDSAAAATATAGAQGGVFLDKYGGYWEMDCGYQFTGTTYYDSNNYVGSNNGGVNFLTGTQGTLTYNTSAVLGTSATLYGSGYMLQANPNLLCPTYNGTYYIDPNNVAYYVLCGFNAAVYNTPADAVPGSQTTGADARSCLTQCDAYAYHNCTGVSILYANSENGANTLCYFKAGSTYVVSPASSAVLVQRMTTIPAAPSYTPTSTTTTTTTTSSLASVTTTETAPTFSCPASDGQTVTENAQSYVIGCSDIVQGSPAGSYAVSNSWNDCFAYCDATTACTGFYYNGGQYGVGAGTCYIQTAQSEGFVASDTYHVGAVRAANYVPLYTTSTTTTTATTTSTTTTKTVDHIHHVHDNFYDFDYFHYHFDNLYYHYDKLAHDYYFHYHFDNHDKLAYNYDIHNHYDELASGAYNYYIHNHYDELASGAYNYYIYDARLCHTTTSSSGLSSSPGSSVSLTSGAASVATVTYTTVSSYPVTYTTSYVTSVITTAPG